MTEEERRAKHRKDRLDRNEREKNNVANFRKLVSITDKDGCDQDMLKCSACAKSIGLKKWARLATPDKIKCPACGATADVGAKVEVVKKEKSRFKIESVENGEASVEERPDGTRLIKETINVNVKATPKKK